MKTTATRLPKGKETGHAKNVGNFDQLIGFCTGYGAAYNPSKPSIKLPALTASLTTAQTALASQKAAKTAFDNATNAREITFKPLKKLSTRIVNALMATDAARQTVDDAQSINFKIHGKRARAKPNTKPISEGEAIAPDHTISVSQLGFDNLIDHFAKLIQTVSAEPLYKPNETDLQVAGLNTMLADMKAKNKAVTTAIANISNARIARNKVLYAESIGLVDISFATKVYVKSVFGSGSPQFKQVSKISFTNMI
jgi:hypothetical protein